MRVAINYEIMTKKLLNISILFVLLFITTNVLATKTYKVACLKDYYPYSSVNEDGELSGIIIDWWKLWAKKTDTEIIFIPTDMQGCIDKIMADEVDIIAGLFYSSQRDEKLDFADNMLRMRTVIFVNNNITVDSLKEISIPIGIVKDDMSELYMKENHPNNKISLFDSYTALRYAAINNEIEAFVWDVPNPVGNYKGLPDPDGYRKLETLFINNLRPAVKNGNKNMLSVITDGFNKFESDDIIAISSQWKMFQPINKSYTLLLYLVPTFIILLGLLFFVLYRNKLQKKKLSSLSSDADVKDIISKGENDSIEFKSSLRWDYHQEKINKALEMVIIKTISAFLNAEGGTLLIGVDDDGNILGLENDYSTFSKNNSDGFLLSLTNLINQNLGKRTHKYISANIISVNDKDVCIINLQKCDKPVFIGKNDKEEFYIRASASSQPMGLREAYEYISSHWDN